MPKAGDDDDDGAASYFGMADWELEVGTSKLLSLTGMLFEWKNKRDVDFEKSLNKVACWVVVGKALNYPTISSL